MAMGYILTIRVSLGYRSGVSLEPSRAGKKAAASLWKAEIGAAADAAGHPWQATPAAAGLSVSNSIRQQR